MRSDSMLDSIDLFTGIGGLALALRSISRPLLYCDIDPACRQVLEGRMRRGQLHRAPVGEDVVHLKPEAQAQLVTAGFPCQDVSCCLRTSTGLGG
ncbi:MAG: DNA cytosine methyltransferase, partial [Deltaproteobacteria bacterium]